MNPLDDRLYERLERLERATERAETRLDEHARRIEALEGIPAAISSLREDLRRIEGRIEVAIARAQTWQTLVWAIMGLILGGIVAAGFKWFER